MNEFQLTSDQQTALDGLLDSTAHLTLIEGAAGTGKTTVIQNFVAEMLNRGRTTVLTAPTNKATRVLREFSLKSGLHVKCSTTYSLFGLNLSNDGSVREIRKARGVQDSYHVLVIDETSMVGEKLWPYIIEEAPFFDQIIFMGDRCQLPPVKEGSSITFDMENRYYLTQVVRQAEGSPILELGNRIRQTMLEGVPVKIDTVILPGDRRDGVYLIRDQQKFESHILSAYDQPEHRTDPNFVKVLCWTNKQVNHYNKMVREHVIGQTTTPLVPGEFAHVRKPINACNFEEHHNLLETNTKTRAITPTDSLVQVESISRDVHPWFTDMQIPVWVVQGIDLDTAEEVTAWVPADGTFEQQSKRLAEAARQERKLWPKYWLFDEAFSDLTYNYALTTHRAQGSTYENVFVDIADVNNMRPALDRLRCTYVACTRPRNKLIVNDQIRH